MIEIFDPALIPALIGTLRLSLQSGHNGRSKMALIAVTIRNQGTIDQFLDLAQSAPFAGWNFGRTLTDFSMQKSSSKLLRSESNLNRRHFSKS